MAIKNKNNKNKEQKEDVIDKLNGKVIPYLIKGGTRSNKSSWVRAKAILTNKRIIVKSKKGKMSIPFGKIIDVGDRYDINQTVKRTPDYISLLYSKEEKTVTLLTAENSSNLNRFRENLYSALINGRKVVVKHPALKGGVVQEDEDWDAGNVRLKNDLVFIMTKSGDYIKIELDSIQDVYQDKREYKGKEKSILHIEHMQEEEVLGTYILGHSSMMGSLEQFIHRTFDEEVDSEIELDEEESQILVSLYSGVSPFEVPELVGMDVEEVEEIYKKLIDLDVLDEVRKRKEVELTARGRNLASKSINSGTG